MANRRVLVKRRKPVRNIRKITRTMQLIATARFQAALNRATATKPFSEKLAEMVGYLSSAGEGASHPLLAKNDAEKPSAMIVISSMRGLCGGYNANVLRNVVSHLDESGAHGVTTNVHMVGRKGINYFRFLGRPMAERITNVGDTPRFETVEPIANAMIDRYTRGELSSVHVAYMRFYRMGRQRPHILQLLLLVQEASEEQASAQAAAGPSVEFEFSPEPQRLLSELLPTTVRVRLFQAFTDAAVSEQIARMSAMKAATDAAGDMITALTRKYNRARQTQITMELLDIVGGANALA